MQKQPSNKQKGIHNIINYFLEEESGNTERAKTYLEEEGFDTEAMKKKVLKIIRKKKFQLTVDQNQSKLNSLKEKAHEYLKRYASDASISVKEAITQLVPKEKINPALFNKLKNIEEGDLLDIMEEQALLGLMEKLDDSSENE